MTSSSATSASAFVSPLDELRVADWEETGTKFAARAISEGLRQEAGDQMRVTVVSPGFVRTDFVDGVASPEVRAQPTEARDRMAIPPESVARAIAFAIDQPPEVDVNEIVVRPTAQG